MSKIVSLKGADANSLTMDAFSSSEIVVTIYKKFKNGKISIYFIKIT